MRSTFASFLFVDIATRPFFCHQKDDGETHKSDASPASVSSLLDGLLEIEEEVENQKDHTLSNADQFLNTYALGLVLGSGTNPNKKLTPRNVHRRTNEYLSPTSGPTERPTPLAFTGPPLINLAKEGGNNLAPNGQDGRHVRRMNVTVTGVSEAAPDESLETCLGKLFPDLNTQEPTPSPAPVQEIPLESGQLESGRKRERKVGNMKRKLKEQNRKRETSQGQEDANEIENLSIQEYASDSENFIDYDDDYYDDDGYDDHNDQKFIPFDYDYEATREEWNLFTQRRQLRSGLAYNNLNRYGWDMEKVSRKS